MLNIFQKIWTDNDQPSGISREILMLALLFRILTQSNHMGQICLACKIQ